MKKYRRGHRSICIVYIIEMDGEYHLFREKIRILARRKIDAGLIAKLKQNPHHTRHWRITVEGSLLLARHKVAYPLFRSRRGGAYLAKYFHKECVLCRIYFRSLYYVRRFTTRRTSSKLIFSRSKCWRERAPPWPGNWTVQLQPFQNLLTSHANGTNCYVHIKRERFEKNIPRR